MIPSTKADEDLAFGREFSAAILCIMRHIYSMNHHCHGSVPLAGKLLGKLLRLVIFLSPSSYRIKFPG